MVFCLLWHMLRFLATFAALAVLAGAAAAPAASSPVPLCGENGRTVYCRTPVPSHADCHFLGVLFREHTVPVTWTGACAPGGRWHSF